MENKKIIAVDFDGTIVKEKSLVDIYAKDFDLLDNAREVMLWLYDNFYVILWTCRNNETLKLALDYLDRVGINFHAVNENAEFLDFETSNKIFADEYIDNRNINCKIDWLEIKKFLSDKYLSNDTSIIVDKVLNEH